MLKLKAKPSLLIIAIALFLFALTSLIDRHGPAVTNWQFSGESPYRHARGIPVEYLQRSLPDGVCQVNDPRCGLQDHQVSALYLLADGIFWLVASTILVMSVERFRQK